MSVAVVGGLNLDVLGMPTGAFAPRDSNIGEIAFRAGGVGHNIAARLTEMGAQAQLITAVGRDGKSALLRDLCAREGIDLSLAIETDLPSCAYLCVHDAGGDMLAAVNDMRAAGALTPAVLRDKLPIMNPADACVIDANLPEETLLFLAENVTAPLVCDPVSAAKAPRVRAILPYLAAMKPNRMEAEALTGESNPSRAARALVAAGVRNVFVSLGAEGVCYADGAACAILPAPPLPRVPLTGAGDAMLAGIVLAFIEQKPARLCAQRGLAAAKEYLTHAR